jgi:mannose-6-phosphate isomerase-like protein (cupin superfamily)
MMQLSAAAVLDPLNGVVQTAHPRRSQVTYVGETGEASAILRRNGVDTLQRSQSTSVSFIGPGSVTNGDFGLFRWNMTAEAGGAGTHFHRTFSESFYVLDGAVTLFDGAGWVRAGEGDLLYVPRGGVHGFRNDSGADASMLILFSPGIPREKYFQELAEITRSGRTLTDEEWADLFARHDQVNV